MVKKILGLDLGSNSIGWALLEEKGGNPTRIINLGSRIFSKAVEAKTPTPKNKKRRDMRLGRRVLQRRARRKQKMLNYLASLRLLPEKIERYGQPEIILNKIGNPYDLRVKGLDEQLKPHELGRILLHFVARRGFLSSKKQMAGDLIDDPDTLEYLEKLNQEAISNTGPSKLKASENDEKKEEEGYLTDIDNLRKKIKQTKCRTLGEYLSKQSTDSCQRNRIHAGGDLRTDRRMYQDELGKIWTKQAPYFSSLPDDFIEQIQKIIFYQRPLKLKKDRVGKCTLEKKKNRAPQARLEVQRFRYWQDINNLTWSDQYTAEKRFLDAGQKEELAKYLEAHNKIGTRELKRIFGWNNRTTINLQDKNIKGNTTACKIRDIISAVWDQYSKADQQELVEDLLTIKKKSALKKRLINHWKLATDQAIKLCLLEFEPGHSNHSLKAINKLLPFLQQGFIYSDARQKAHYGYDKETDSANIQDTLCAPPPTSNPIVNKGLHELKRVVNAIIKEYGKPDAIRIEMARDLEMNTQKYKDFINQKSANEKANDEALKEYHAAGNTGYPNYEDKLKYRLWKEQKKQCIYSYDDKSKTGANIPLAAVFTADVEIDHILPYSRSLDDSYMNKVLCLTKENRKKGQRTPIDAFSGEQWEQIIQRIKLWKKDKKLQAKHSRFFTTQEEMEKRDFTSSQLNDTRYISKLAQEYVASLGSDISVTKGFVVSELRHQWGFDNLIGEENKKERTDHRHHAIDAVVIAATSRSLYQRAVDQLQDNDKKLEVPIPYPGMKNELQERLTDIIVSHDVQRKISSTLHEETSAGFIERHGGTVYRKPLNEEFTPHHAKKILDATVQQIILDHLSKYSSSKEAFNENTVYHKDNKTPIKRVRILQVKTPLKRLEKIKFPIKDSSGKIFKWMTYGNMHHVEIIQHEKTNKYKGVFVPMMKAAHRTKGIGMPKQPVVKTHHDNGYKFIMALHINDLISINGDNEERIFYRVQQLEQAGKISVTLHTAAYPGHAMPKDKKILQAITTFMTPKYDLKKHQVNIIGHLIRDD